MTCPVDVLRVHVPSFGTATVVEKQLGADSLLSHNFIRDAERPEPTSFERGEIDNVCAMTPTISSSTGFGATGAFTVAVIVDNEHVSGGAAGAHVPDTVLQMTYEIGVAVPEKVESGTKATV